MCYQRVLFCIMSLPRKCGNNLSSLLGVSSIMPNYVLVYCLIGKGILARGLMAKFGRLFHYA